MKTHEICLFFSPSKIKPNFLLSRVLFDVGNVFQYVFAKIVFAFKILGNFRMKCLTSYRFLKNDAERYSKGKKRLQKMLP